MPQDNKIKIRRGLDANLPDFNTEIGELRYSTDTKKLYIDDGTANRYIGGDVNAFPISTVTQQALNNKLEKGTYNGTASDLLTNDQNLLQVLQNEQSARYSADQGLENSKQKKLSVITIVGNITLTEIHNGAILHITNTCNITIPTGLGADFSCDCYVKGAFIATFVNGGVTLNSPSGLLLKTDKMATLYSSATNVFNLLGELATS